MTAIEQAAEARGISANELVECVLATHKTTSRIANELGVSSSAVWARLKRMGYEHDGVEWVKPKPTAVAEKAGRG
jgi:hypothetical protein